jgi:hypothetical protein
MKKTVTIIEDYKTLKWETKPNAAIAYNNHWNNPNIVFRGFLEGVTETQDTRELQSGE